MKKNKGFTLIEIIAVVIIIGIIALIAVPSVSSYITNSRKTTYYAHEKTMEEAAKSMTIEVINGKDNFTLPKTGDHAEVFLNELIDKEYLDSLKDPSTGDLCNESMSYVIIKNTGSSNYGYKSCLYCGSYITEGDECSAPPVGDNEKPVCGMVTGESSEWTNKSRTITVACSDTESGCTRNKFSKTFNSTATKGFIQISDKSGKTNDCEVNVRVDKTEPTCELIVDGDGNVESTGWSSGRTVVVKFKEGSRKDEHSGISTYGIGTSLKNRNYNKQESYAIENISGTTTIFGYVKDNAGNEGVCYKTVTTGLERPVFDVRYGYQIYPLKERFELSGATQSGDNKITTTTTTPSITFKNMSKYKNVTAVIIELTSGVSDPSQFKLKIDGNTYSGSSDNSSNSRIRFYIEKEPGMNTISSISDYMITLGNKKDVTYTITRIELEQKSGNIVSKHNVSVNLMTRKTVVKSTGWSWDNGSHWENQYYKLFDPTTGAKSGNARVKNDIPLTSDPLPYSIVTGDSTVPTITITSGNTNWTNQNIILTGKIKDTGTGLIGYMWSTSNDVHYYDAGWKYFNTSKTEDTVTYKIVDNGTYYLYTKDEAGNVNKNSITVTNIDLDPPTCTSSGDNTTWKNSAVTVYWGCKDQNGKSGCATQQASKTFNGNNTFTKTWEMPAYDIYDVAGNKTTCPKQTRNIYYDKQAPTCTSSGGSASWTNGNRTLTGTCADQSGASGCVSNITKKYSSNTNSTTESPGTVKDNAGNSVTCPGNQTVKIDKTPPTCTSSGGNATWTNGNRTLTGTCSDTGGSGCTGNVTKAYTSNTNSTTESPGTVYDTAGNSVTCPGNQTVKIDKTAPTCASSGGSASWTNGNRTLTGTCSDTGGSGCTGNASKTYTDVINSTTESPGTVYDAAGNSVTCPGNQTVRIEKTLPSCSTSKSGGNSTAGVTVTVSCSDTGGSGVSSCPGTDSGVKSDKTYTVTDAAGNSSTCSVSISSYDCEPYDCNPHDCNPHDCNCETCGGGCAEQNIAYDCNTLCMATYNGDMDRCCTQTPFGCARYYPTYSCNCKTCYDTCYDRCYKTCYK